MTIRLLLAGQYKLCEFFDELGHTILYYILAAQYVSWFGDAQIRDYWMYCVAHISVYQNCVVHDYIRIMKLCTLFLLRLNGKDRLRICGMISVQRVLCLHYKSVLRFHWQIYGNCRLELARAANISTSMRSPPVIGTRRTPVSMNTYAYDLWLQ